MSHKRLGTYRFNDCELDLAHRALRRAGHPVAISPQTFDLLALLVINAPRPVTQDLILRVLWPDASLEESNLGQHIYLLRKALEDPEPGEKIIVTHRDGSYTFTPPVAFEPEPDEPHPSHTHAGFEANIPAPSATSHPVSDHNTHDAEDEGNERSSPPSAASRLATIFRRSAPLQLAVSLAGLCLIAVAVWFFWKHQHTARAASFPLVVGDFQNSTGNPAFDQSIKAALTIDLRQSPYFDVLREDQLRSVLALIYPSEDPAAAPPTALTPQSALAVCRRLRAQATITGEIRRLGRHHLISVLATDCATGADLAHTRGIADTPDAVPALLDKIAADLRHQLGESRTSVQHFSMPLFPAGTGSLTALKAYADAVQLNLDGKLPAALKLFEHATTLDPQFANAWEEAGLAYANLGQRDQSIAALSRAYQLRAEAGPLDRYSFIARYSYLVTGDLQASIRNFSEASDIYPRNAVFLAGLADLQNRVGKPALAIEPAGRAITLDPGNAAAYAILAHAHMRLGQFEQAVATCHHALELDIDTPAIHTILLQIAFLRLDQPAINAQLAWANGKSAEPEMVLQQGLIDFALGKIKTGQTDFAAAATSFQKQGQLDRAIAAQAMEPRILAELGRIDLARPLLARLPQDISNPDLAVAWAEIGDTTRAEALLALDLANNSSSTHWQQDYAPQIRAAIALNQHRPEDAVTALQNSQPYDLAGFQLPALRGRALLAADQPDLAEAQFHAILDHPGIEPLSHNYPLAQLGLARALARQGKTVDAGFAYKVVLQIWKDADPDLPRFREAKAEFDALNAGTAKSQTRSSARSNTRRH